MRPQVAGESLQHSIKHPYSDREGAPTVSTPETAPTTFFMAREEDLDKREIPSDGSDSAMNYGVQSLADTIGGIIEESSSEENKQAVKKHVSPKKGNKCAQEGSFTSHHVTNSSIHQSPAHPLARRSPVLTSQPMTPLSSVSPYPGSSLPSSPKSTSSKSFRPSDEDSMDETGSQAIMYSAEEQQNETVAALEESMPQLIMPSLKMPSRRPFTERGRNIGRLKILLAGDTGVGKTSLIKSILQTCEDIVHVDPLSHSSPSLETLSPRGSKRKGGTASSNSTVSITEIYASTRPYPSWWSNFEENRVLKRRKSLGDTVLERNLCFVDTPGTGTKESVDSILNYIDAQATRALDLNRMDNGDLMSLIAGNGGTQVDVVFYLFSKEQTQSDLDFLLGLKESTNIIPILNKCDKMTDAQEQSIQRSIKIELEEQGVKTFSFTSDSPRDIKIYSTCSAPSHDDDDMDASLLVSPDYVQPLLPSELTLLIEQFFEKDNISYLKHTAAKKLLNLRAPGPNTSQLGLTPRGSSLLKINTPGLIPPPLSSSSMMSSWSDLGTLQSPASPYVQARILDHIQREETLAQIHLAKWAGELQRRLQVERQRFEGVAQSDQLTWLSEKMDECQGKELAKFDEQGTLKEGNTSTSRKTRKKPHWRDSIIDPDDPLGLIRWQVKMRRRGWIAFQLVGGLGIIGAVAVWAWRTWNASYEQALWSQANTNTRWLPHQQPGSGWYRGLMG